MAKTKNETKKKKDTFGKQYTLTVTEILKKQYKTYVFCNEEAEIKEAIHAVDKDGELLRVDADIFDKKSGRMTDQIILDDESNLTTYEVTEVMAIDNSYLKAMKKNAEQLRSQRQRAKEMKQAKLEALRDNQEATETSTT